MEYENVFRKQYRQLSDAEKAQIEGIKVTAAVLYHQLHVTAGQADARQLALAKTKLEECVMWATKAITG